MVHRPISFGISLYNFIFKLFLYLFINSKEAPNTLKISINAAVFYYSWEQSKDSIDAKLSNKIRDRSANSNTPAGLFFPYDGLYQLLFHFGPDFPFAVGDLPNENELKRF